MGALLENARLAWNPIGEVRRRLQEGRLSLGPFLAVVIACNMVAGAAQQFFFEALAFGSGVEIPNHPLVDNSFAQRFLASAGVIVPATVVWALPDRVHYPSGRTAVVASVFVVAAGWAFYGAAIGLPVYFIAGAVATANAQAGGTLYVLLSIPTTLIIFGLVAWFWFRVLLTELRLTVPSVALITICGVVALAIIAGLLVLLVS